jgi:hypothetical protein
MRDSLCSASIAEDVRDRQLEQHRGIDPDFAVRNESDAPVSGFEREPDIREPVSAGAQNTLLSFNRFDAA